MLFPLLNLILNPHMRAEKSQSAAFEMAIVGALATEALSYPRLLLMSLPLRTLPQYGKYSSYSFIGLRP